MMLLFFCPSVEFSWRAAAVVLCLFLVEYVSIYAVSQKRIPDIIDCNLKED